MKRQKQTKALMCELTEDELRERGDEMAKTMRDKEEHLKAAKACSEEAKECEQKIQKLKNAILYRQEQRQVECSVAFIGDGMVEVVRDDTGMVVERRPMTDDERQLKIDLDK